MSEAPTKRRKIAVVLFNLGGPEDQASVRPFLRNLFADPAIIGLPAAIRIPLAAGISAARAKSARANYARMGGGSPLLSETENQRAALTAALRPAYPGDIVELFIAMRYWRPFTEDTARAVASFAPDEIVLLPLYPQFSTTTTGSSLTAWKKAYKGPGRTHTVCCYPVAADLVAAHAEAIRTAWAKAGSPAEPRLLFSAHGLPLKVIEAGDPYQNQVERTCIAVAEALAKSTGRSWDWRVCYQSRVGPMKWLGPATPDAIAEAGEAGRAVVITPIAFVSEHIETLVELDHDYAKVAEAAGCSAYIRVPALGAADRFIKGLATSVSRALDADGTRPDSPPCAGFSQCPHARETPTA